MSLSISTLQAQCNMAITNISANEDCSNYTAPFLSMSWAGGTSPCTVVVVAFSGLTTQGTSTIGQWSGFLVVTEWDYQATITITDAVGCTASTTISWLNHYPVEPDLTLTGDCVSGSILRWTGKYHVGSGAEYFSTCGLVFYSITNIGTNTQVQSGDLYSDWVLESGTIWRYPGWLPAGNYYVYIGANGGQCDQGIQVICFNPRGINVPATPSGCGTNLQMRAALAGALPSGTVMTDHLRAANVIPSVEPYSALGYTYTGITAGATIQPSVLSVTGNNAIVDWVIVELRSASNPATVLYSRPALIQRDGDVVGLNGSSSISTSLAAGNYRIAIRHRNHLGVMTAGSIALSSTLTTVDFTNASTATYGTNARTLIGSVMCLWPGDANSDGTAIYTGTNNDRDQVLQAIGGIVPTNTVTNTYSTRDVNMDGTIRYTGINNDRDVILQTIGGVVPTATRTQQLP